MPAEAAAQAAVALAAPTTLERWIRSCSRAIEFPVLQAVPRRLMVVMNPALRSAGLATVLAATTSLRKVGGNQGDTPLASCPWTNDDHCDQKSNVCAAGSDIDDCNRNSPPY